MIDNTSVATAWLRGLAARGVTASIRNNRLCLHPASAHKTFTDAEVLTLRHHRDEIKAVIAAGVSFDVVRAQTQTAPTPQALPPCPYCHRPCVGREHFAFDLLHHDDPEEVEQRRQDATVEMMATVGYRTSRWL